MDKSWYRRMFSAPQKPIPQTAARATDYENADVQFGLGLKFAGGEGPARDYAQAAEWYRKAAEQHPPPVYNPAP